jgi:hypothetical protein
MRLYVLIGDRALALRQYTTCRELLARELGVAPMPETEALARLLCQAVPRLPDSDAPRHQVCDIKNALLEMKKQLDEMFRIIGAHPPSTRSEPGSMTSNAGRD